MMTMMAVYAFEKLMAKTEAASVRRLPRCENRTREILDSEHYCASGAINISRRPTTPAAAAAAEMYRLHRRITDVPSPSPVSDDEPVSEAAKPAAADDDNPAKGSRPGVYISAGSSFNRRASF